MSVVRPSRYRSDIDGLRAIAILPVLLFHYRVQPFGGGFVGVDVFFVISGYLITQLIESDRRAGRFTFAHFYERRVRRIFPALFAMLAATTVIAVVILFPADLVRYARSLLATAVFGLNFEFWHEAGYFDVIAEEKPLLHLWSIAVEEQFYLLFPSILLLAVRWRQSVAVVSAIFVLSFALSAWGVTHAPTATFYLLPGRAWELMLGALLALKAVPVVNSRLVREAVASAGFTFIAASVFLYSRDTPFPGPAALLPCLGAALIIYAGDCGTSAVGAILSLSPFAFIGRISYSLYLWHWPLYVFVRYLDFRDPAPAMIVFLIALSFGLATLSYYFIEQPFRRPANRISRQRLFAGGGTAMGVGAVIEAFLLMGEGLPERLRPAVRTLLAGQDDHEPRIESGVGMTAADVRDGRLCRIGAQGGVPSFILWGDSHADAVLPAIADVAAREGRTGYFAGGRSCPPLVDVSTPMADCRAFNAAVLALAARPQIREVILDARWAKYAEGSTYGDEPEGHIHLKDDTGAAESDNHDVFVRGLQRTIAALSGKKVVVVASVPEIGWPVPAVLAREKLAARTRAYPPSEDTYLARQKFVLATFARLRRDDGVAVVYPHEVLCKSGVCAVSLNGIPLYRDEHHLSVYGARQLTPLIGAVL